MWNNVTARKKRPSNGTLSSITAKAGAASPSDPSVVPVSPYGSTIQMRRDTDASRRVSQQSGRLAVFSEGAHTFWSMRSGMQGSRTYLQEIKARDLMCMVASIVSIALVLVSIHAVMMSSSSNKKNVVVDGDFGSVHGSFTIIADVLVTSFLGVPYAERNTLRFGAPVPWHRKLDQFDATSPAPACAQANDKQDGMNASTSEDCLHLNIWTPSCDGRICPGNLTIVLFLHGGFFQTGSNNDPYHDGGILAAVGGVMVVVPNWRLGLLGFVSMATADSPLNAGFLDQVEAFLWIRRNAGPFGGNVSDIVVVAHAAGASALGYHLFANQGALPGVRKVVFMSESPFTRYPVYGYNRAPDQKRAILARLLCDDDAEKDTWLQCLRDLPVQALFRTPPGALRSLPTFFPILPIMWNPIMWKKFAPTGMSVLIGFSENEAPALSENFANYLNLNLQDNEKSATSLLTLLGIPQEEAAGVALNYSKTKGSGRRQWVQELLSDIAVVCPVRMFAEQLHALGNHVHTFVFHSSDAVGPPGVGRADIIRILFGYVISRDLTIEEQVFSRRVIERMAHFFKTGEMHTENDTITSGKFSLTVTSASNHLPRWRPDLRKDDCENLRKYFPVMGDLPGQR
ncbi:hypothetical protein HPB50_026353 [Hyalomma asiaticum]|uniref:Uncharacterized protein n=1 Tax=Hyalomma asiaticum TaxID=266040 RepID=A0ACB7SZ45_HYAAI|nr:hypothetical protein HPB50_026353 [Hyalomma asiaticum]